MASWRLSLIWTNLAQSFIPIDIHLLVTFAIIHFSALTEGQIFNQYAQSTGPNGEDIWQSTSDFVPIQEGLYGNIRIGELMIMKFDFVWDGYSNDPYPPPQYENFFRVGFSHSLGTSCDGHASRYPLRRFHVRIEMLSGSDSQTESALRPIKNGVILIISD